MAKVFEDYEQHERTCTCIKCMGDPEEWVSALELIQERQISDPQPDPPIIHSPVIHQPMGFKYWIAGYDDLKELIAWVSDQGFEARIHGIFSSEHDLGTLKDDYSSDHIAEFTWGWVVYTPINSVEV